MIPSSEWKFFEGTEQRLKHLARHRRENTLAYLSGNPPPWDPEELAARHAAMLSEMEYANRVEAALAADPTPEQARHLELHRRGVVQALFATHPDLVPVVRAIRETEAAFSPKINDRPVTFAERARLLREEPDRDLREAAFHALNPLAEELLPQLTELLRRREMLARAVVQSGFPAVANYVLEMDRSETVGLVDAFERHTRSAFGEVRAALNRELGILDLEPWDLAYGLSVVAPDAALDPLAAAREQAARWGWDRHEVAVHEDPALALPAWIVAHDAPAEVSVHHRGAAAGWTEPLRAYGAAAHLTAAQSARFYLQESAPVLREASAWLLALATREAGWWENRPGAPADMHRYGQARRWEDLLLLREHAAHTAFENLIYAESRLDPHRLFCDVMEHMMQETRRRTPRWAADPRWTVAPFARSVSLVGAMIAAAWAQRLRAEYDDYWNSPEAGAWVLDRFQKPGAGAPWDEVFAAEMGSRLEMEPLAAELGVVYTGPTLEESEGLSDEAVEDYFKDIDLSDVDLD